MGEGKGFEEKMKRQGPKNIPVMTMLLLLFSILIVAGAFQYKGNSRMLPLIVGIPTFLLLLVLVLGETVFPRLISSFDIDLIGLKRSDTKQPADEDVKARVRWTGSEAFLFVSVWLIAFVILLLLFGYNIGICLSVLAFVKLYGNQSWLRSALLAIGVWAFAYVVFHLAMGLQLFQGLLFGGKVIM